MTRLGTHKDISGLKKEYFTVTEPTRDEKGKLIWRCKCCCGNEFLAARRSIEIGKVKSCGCMRKSLRSEYMKKSSKIKIGDIFGQLEVISVSYGDDGRAIYKCTCHNCGGEIELSQSHLVKRYSCGCLTSGENRSLLYVGKDSKANTSGCVGVTYDGAKSKWKATIGRKYIGRFDKKEDAIKARKQVEADLVYDNEEIIEKQKVYKTYLYETYGKREQ